MLKLYNKEHEVLSALTNLKDYKIEYVLSGEDLLEFSLSRYDENIPLIQEECYIRTEYNEYVIKAIEPSDNFKRFTCNINIESLVGKVIKNFDTKNNNINDTIRLAIAGTGWTLADNSISKKRTVSLKNTNALEVLRKVRETFRVDFRFDAINKIIYVYEKLGSDKGVYFTDELNLISLDVPSDSYDYATRLYAKGKDGLTFADINNGKDYIENFQYSNKIIEKIWEDNRYTNKQNLKEDAEAKLEELSKPRRNYNVQVYDLAKNNSEFSFLDFSIGDTVTIISNLEKFKDKQRIVKYIEYPEDPSQNTCELGNTTLTFEELQKANEAKNQVVENITSDNGTVDGSKVDSITTEQISDFEAEVAKITDLTVVNAEITNLKAQNVTITGKLNAIEGEFGTIKANVGVIDKLTVTHTAQINSLEANKASITQLNAVSANIGTLEADVGKINTLLAGNLTSTNIQAGGITSDKLTIANGFITNAMIANLDVSKINAGDISTNKFKIKSDNGGIEIVGATQQFKDKNNRVRIQMGQDTQGNFNFIIRGEDGTTTLIDHTGIKEKAIADDLIKETMIAQDAIGEKQINYSSFITGFNKDTNTNTIKSTKIMLNNQNQTLDVAFNSLKTYSETTRTQLDNLDIGGRNLIDLSGNFINNTGSLISNGATLSLDSSNKYKGYNSIKIVGHPGAKKSSSIELEPNTTYVYSVTAKATSNLLSNSSIPLHMWLSTTINGTDHLEIILDYSNASIKTNWGQSWIIFKTPANAEKYYFTPFVYGIGDATVWLANMQLEKGNKPTDWTLAPEDVDSAIGNVKEITESNSTTIGIMQGQISTAINNTQITKDGQIILLKDDYNRTVQTVDSMKVTIGQHTSKIDGLNSTVSTQTSDISQLKNQIKLKVEQTDINAAVNNIQISGRNLTPNSGEFKTTNHWTPNGFGSVSLEDSCIKGTQSIKHEYTDLKAGSTYMVSLVFKTNAESFNANDGNGGHFHILYDGHSDVHFGKKSCVLVYKDPYKVNEFCKYIYKIEVKEGLVNPKLRTMVYHGDGSLAGKTIWLKTLMVEEGNKPTGWVPAIEDVESSISAIDSKITTTNSKVSSIETNLSSITSRVSSTETTLSTTTSTANNALSQANSNKSSISSLTTRVSTAESKLTKDSLTTTIGSYYTTTNDVNGIVTSKGYQTASQVQQTVNGLEVKVSQSGGYNLLRNGLAKNGTAYWYNNGGGISVQTANAPTDLHKYFNSSFPSGITGEWIELKNNTNYIYSSYIYLATSINMTSAAPLHYWCNTTQSPDGNQLTVIDKSHSTIPANQWVKIWINFKTAASGKVWFKPFLYTGGANIAFNVTELMLCESSLLLPWTPHPSEIYDGITSIDKDGITVTSSNVKSKTSMSANGFKITKTDTNRDVFKVNADGTLYFEGQVKITSGLDGTSTTGEGGRKVTIDKANYTVSENNQERAFLGFKNMGNGYDKYVVPKLAMGAFGYGLQHNYFTIIPYRGTDNPQGITNAYVDIAYHMISHDDYSNIKMYDGGDIRLAPVKNLEITTNYVDGKYVNADERRMAQFTTSGYEWLGVHLQTGGVSNHSNGYGLILSDRYRSDSWDGTQNGGGSKITSVRVHTDADGKKFFRPLNTSADIELGSGSYPWKSLSSKTTYSSTGIVANLEAKRMNDITIDNVLDNIEFPTDTVRTLDNEEGIIMDVTNLRGTKFVDTGEDFVYIDNNEMIKLLLKEVKYLKEEIQVLKGIN